jgi:murein L,D-transpeptidase YafK
LGTKSNIIKNVFHTLLLIQIACSSLTCQVKSLAFKTGQLKNSRVSEAYNQKWDSLKNELTNINVDPNTFDIYIRAFKFEKIVEIWVKNPKDIKYKFLKKYDICTNSGDLGPKRKEGDGQVPEGFYRIEAFNPKSNYHLSLKVNYPNASDLVLKEDVSPGGAIMIHGNCVSIGCIPITDDKIKELYVLCLEARNRNNPIYIDIFPAMFTPENVKMLDSKSQKTNRVFGKH